MAKKSRTTKKVEPESKPDPKTISPLDHALRLTGPEGIMLTRITSVGELLNDREALADIAQRVATGASISTIEMVIGLPPGVMKGWLRNGKGAKDTDPYGVFYRFYLCAAAEAKQIAESSLLAKQPGKWLETCEPLHQLGIRLDGEESQTVQGKVIEQANATHKVAFKDFDD